MQNQSDDLAQLLILRLVDAEGVDEAQQGDCRPSVDQTVLCLLRHLYGDKPENVR